MSVEIVSLENLGRGACVEKFDDCLQQVLDNILDPNTGTAARAVTLKVTIKPNEARTLCAVSIACDPKLVFPKPFMTEMFVGSDGKKAIATEHNPNQEELTGMGNSVAKTYRLHSSEEGKK